MTELLAELRRTRILAILRGVPAQRAPRLVGTLRDSGIELFEVALSDDLGLPALRAVRAAFPDLVLGAGTVVTPALAQQAEESGAAFLVTPHLIPEVSAHARSRGLGLLAGALTPTEISAAHAQGSAAVKVFPAGSLGPEYFEHLRGPYPHLPLLAVGGVDARNLSAYLQAGAVAVGIGGALTRTDWTDPDWAALSNVARELVKRAHH
jgi:2-dehydro-3-deoxyphosphogluconate aldolase/(4S)-4-hydroxy-2-oxoglutarate aldolase